MTPAACRCRSTSWSRSGTTTRAPFWRRFPVWFPFAVFALSRLFVWVAATYLSRYQIPLPIGTANIRIFYPSPADPGYNAIMTGWDGQWYRVIAEQGYPAVLPRVGWGGIDMNPWAFFPVFPMTAGLVMKVTGLPFGVVAPMLSTLIGFVAMHMLFKLVDQAVGRWEAIVAVGVLEPVTEARLRPAGRRVGAR